MRSRGPSRIARGRGIRRGSGGGFTLIELLVVIAIIGVLAGLLLAAVFQVLKSAKRTVAKEDLDNLAKGINSYYERNLVLPADPWNNFPDPPSAISDPTETRTFIHRLLGNGDPAGNGAYWDAPLGRLRSPLVNPSNPRVASDVIFLDPWQQNGYLYVRGIASLSFLPASWWKGNGTARYNLWTAGPDLLCDSCAEAGKYEPAPPGVPSPNYFGWKHADRTAPAGAEHRGGDEVVWDDIVNWGK